MTEQKSMLLSELFEGLAERFQNICIEGITHDSRKVEKNYLFVALKGVKVDGVEHIADAVARGAVAVLMDKREVELKLSDDIAVIKDNNPRKKLAGLAQLYFGSQPGFLAAVTGTNGKSSVATFVREIWQKHGFEAASIGTLGVEGEKYSQEGGLTTPDSLDLQRYLAEMNDAGVSHAIMEASSHGLSQYRLDGNRFQVAAFTNLTRDHMDYHEGADDYFEAKARLFTDLLKDDGTAVINLSDKWGDKLVERMKDRGIKTITVGEDARADICLMDIQAKGPTQNLLIGYRTHTFDVHLPLAGRFQAWNLVVAAGIAIASGMRPAEVFRHVEGLKPVPGRMELAGMTRKGGHIYVDYAHTPDGLQHALKSARALATSRLSVVFGCGGDRDRGKRPLMGEVAAQFADRVYVTDDNPRSENPAAIRKEVMAACPGAKNIGDRAKAIAKAIEDLEFGDALVVSGKGHETGQIMADKTVPFDDFEAIRHALDAISGQKSLNLGVPIVGQAEG